MTITIFQSSMLSLQRDERKHSHCIPFSVAKEVLGTTGTILLSRTGTFVDATLSKGLQNFAQLPYSVRTYHESELMQAVSLNFEELKQKLL